MISVTEFSKKIKQKYPQYKDMDDYLLAEKIVKKYPAYADQVDFKKKEEVVPSVTPVTPSAEPSVPAVKPITEPVAPSPAIPEIASRIGQAVDDPIGASLNPIKNELVRIRTMPVAESTAQSAAQREARSRQVTDLLTEERKIEKNARKFFTDTEAEFRLNSKLDKSKLVMKKGVSMQKPVVTLDDYTPESISAATNKQNLTDQVALDKYLRTRSLKEVLSESPDLETAAIKLALKKGGLAAEQIRELSGNIPSAMRANLLSQFLSDKDLYEIASKDANLTQSINEAVYNFPQNYPSAAVTVLASLISDEREKEGYNNAILNVTGESKNDEIVDKLVSTGKLPIEYKNFYERPEVRFIVNNKLKTSGLVENVVGGLETGVMGLGKSLAELTGARSLYKSEKDVLYEGLAKRYENFRFKPKGLIHEITTSGGNVVGQFIPIALGGNALLAAKIVQNPTVANSIMTGLQAYGENKEQAEIELAGKSAAEKEAYALINTGIEVATENILNDVKLAQDIAEGYRPQVENMIVKFTAKEISAAAAEKNLKDIFADILTKSGKFAAGALKISESNAREEVVANIAQNLTRQIFTGEDMSITEVANQAFDTWKTSLLGGLFLGVPKGISQMRTNPASQQVILEIAQNPDYYKSVVEGGVRINPEMAENAKKKIENIDYAGKVYQALQGRTDLTYKQKQKFLATSLNEKILKDAIDSTPDKALVKKEEEELKNIQAEKERILTEPQPVEPQREFKAEEVVTEEAVPAQFTMEAPRIAGEPEQISNEEAENKLKEIWNSIGNNRGRNALEDGWAESFGYISEALNVGGQNYQAHGMGKSGFPAALRDLFDLFKKGIDPNRGGGQLYTAPLSISQEDKAAAAAIGTAGGTAYTDGAFVLVAKRGIAGIRSIDDIGGILVNSGITDINPEILTELRKAFPNLVIESYKNTKGLVEQLNAKAGVAPEVKSEVSAAEAAAPRPARITGEPAPKLAEEEKVLQTTEIAESFKKDYNEGKLQKGKEYGGGRNLGIFDYANKIIKVVKEKRRITQEQIALMKKRLGDMVNVIIPNDMIDLGNGKFGIVMEKAKGIDASKLTPIDIENIPQEHWDKFENDIRELSKRGVAVDLTKRDNFFYDKDSGFQFLDISGISVDGSPTKKFFIKDGVEYYYPFEQYPFFEKKAEGGRKIFENIEGAKPEVPSLAGESVPAQFTMEAPRIAGEPEQISKPIELSIEPKAGEVAPEVPQPTRESISKEIADLRAKEQAEYAAMPDSNDKAKRKEIYDRYDKLITPLLEKEKALVAPQPAVQKFGVGFAPFREKNVFNEGEDVEIRNSPDYKLHQENVQTIADGLGIKVKSKLDTWGGYVDSETGKPVQEVSNIMEIEATPQQARVMAAILGKAAPEMQDSVLIGNYNPEGAGLEHIVKTGSFANAQEAIKLLKDNGLQYFSVDKNSGDVIILDLEATDTPKIVNLVKQLNENGIPTKHSYGKVNAEFIGSGEYDGIIEAERGRIGTETGFDIDAFVQEARGKYEAIKAAGEAKAVTPEAAAPRPEAKSIADKIRNLKVDLSKLGGGGLQSNIAGLPVAVYNTVVEAVALAVEAGTSVNKAISDAIKQYKLSREKGFDKDEFSSKVLKGLTITEPEASPVYFENLKTFASESAFDNKLEFKKAVQDLLNQYLPELKKKYGSDFNPSVYDERTKKYLSDALTKEALNAVSEHPEAIGWYDEKTQSALDAVSSIHPEIATDVEARGAFILPLAIMSNGNKVDFNFELAEEQYRYFKENGRFNPDGEFGLQQNGIRKSLKLINSLLDNGLTMSDINKFLTSKFRAGDLKIKINGKAKNLASGELADEPVYGAVILGSKIGNGFYMNLWGQFDQLTMDRWFMRTWGRNTGTLVKKDAKIIANSKSRFSEALKEVRSDKDAASILKSVLPKEVGRSAEEFSSAIVKASMDKKKRALLSSNEKTDELRKSSNNYAKNLTGEKEAPANGKERKFIRDVFGDVLSNLKDKHGIEISMADLQAALWYPEKILYESFKAGETFEEAAEGYTSESAPDYLNAAKKLATKLGINETEINQALSRGRERAERVSGEGYARAGEAVGEPYPDVIGRVREALGGEPVATRAAKEKVKKVTKAVRSLKIKQEGLQANIAGLPIALYNSAVEAVALAIEAGATLKDAIDSVIDKYNLNKQKGFNPDEFIKPIEDATGESYPKKGGVYAIQERGAEEVLQRPSEGAGEAGGQRERMEQGKQRIEAAEKENEIKSEEEEYVRFSLGGIQRVGDKFGIQIERDPKVTDEQLVSDAEKTITEWQQKGEYASNIEKLLSMVEGRTGVLTSLQRVILENHLNNEKKALESLDPTSREFDAKLLQIQRLLNLASMARSEAGRALRIPDNAMVTHPVESLPDALVAKMDANGQDALTDKQKEEVIKQVANYEEASAKAEEAIRIAEERASLLTISEIESENKLEEKKTGRKKTKEQRQQDRKNAIEAARKALKDLRDGVSGFSAVPLPGVRELIVIAPHVKTVVASYVGEGIDNLSVIIDKAYEEFKDVLPGLSKRNVRQIISGQFNSKAPESEYKKLARQIQTEAKLLEQYELLLEQAEPVSEKEKVKRNRKFTELRNKIRNLRGENVIGETYGDDKIPDELTKIKAITARNGQMLKDIQDKLANKDFSKPETTKIIGNQKLKKQYPKEYNAMLDAIKKREDAKHEFDIALLKDEMSREKKIKKIGRFGAKVVATLKALRSGIDDSAVLVQNYVAILSYPKSGVKAFFTHIDLALSQKRFDRWFTELKNNPEVWDLIQKGGLDVTEPSSIMESKREEAFSNNLIDKTFRVGGKTYNIGKYLTRPFERLFTAMGNALRVDVYLRIAEKWNQQGKTIETNLEDYKALAQMLNTQTGRAKLHKNIQAASDLITPVIWSPRLMQSKFNILGLSDLASVAGMGKGYYSGLTPEVRKYALQNLAKFVGVGTSLMLLASVTGAGDVDFDPESVNFGTIRIGSKRFSVFDGFNKYVKTVTQIVTGRRKVPTIYESGVMEMKREKVQRAKSVLRFFRGSATPAGGLVINLLDGKDYMGKPVTFEKEALSMVEPMSISGFRDEIKRDGVIGLANGFYKFFGGQVSDENDFETRAVMEVTDPVTGEKRPISEKEYKEFSKIKEQAYSELLDDCKEGYTKIYVDEDGKINLSEKGDELDYEDLKSSQIKELLKLLESKAKKMAKKELDL